MTCLLPTQPVGDDHEIVGEHGGADEEFEPFVTFGTHALHPASSEQDRDAAFDAGAEPLPFLKRRALLERFPFGAPLAARLGNAREGHARRLARLKVRLAEEPRSVLYRSGAWPKASVWRSSDGVT